MRVVMRTACLIRGSSWSNRALMLELETNSSRLMMLELGALPHTMATHGIKIRTTMLITLGIMVRIQAAM